MYLLSTVLRDINWRKEMDVRRRIITTIRKGKK